MGRVNRGGQDTMLKGESHKDGWEDGTVGGYQDEHKAFAFLAIGPHSAKPRASGLTVVVDGMDGGFLSLRDVESLGDFAAEYVDYVKLGWTIARLARASVIRRKIELLHRVGIRVLLGGVALEYASVHGYPEELIKECVELGIDAIEVSTSSSYISVKRQIELVKYIRGEGPEAFVELGRKGEARNPTVTDVSMFLARFADAGVSRLILESERIAATGAEGELEAFLEGLAAIDHDKVIIELPYGISFPELLPVASQVFGILGPEVNVANIDPRHVLAVETLRTGICFGELFARVPVEASYQRRDERLVSQSGKGSY